MLWQRAFTKDILSIFLEYKLAHPQFVGWAFLFAIQHFIVCYCAITSFLMYNFFFTNEQ